MSELDLHFWCLSAQRALLDEVSSALRGVAITAAKSVVEVTFFYDGKISAEDLESVSNVMSQMLADAPESVSVTDVITRADNPTPIATPGVWVFRRRE